MNIQPDELVSETKVLVGLLVLVVAWSLCAVAYGREQADVRVVLGKIGPHDTLEIAPDGTVTQIKTTCTKLDFTEGCAAMIIACPLDGTVGKITVNLDVAQAISRGDKPKPLKPCKFPKPVPAPHR
jgi:hypothetical protein